MSPKLLDLINSLSALEMQQLVRFSQSSWFNTRDDAAQLLRLFQKLHPDLAGPTVSREALHRALYPGKAYRDLWMRQLGTIVLKIAEEFLKVKAMEADPVAGELLLMQAYRERGLQKHFNGSARRARQQQAQGGLHDADFFYRQYRIESEAELMRAHAEGRKPETNLQAIANNLDTFYLAGKLKVAVQMTTDQTIFGMPYDQPMVPELLQHIKQHEPTEPLVQLYHSALLSLMNPDADQYFFILKGLLENHRDVVTKTEEADLHTVARNFAIRQVNSGRLPEFLPELFELYELALHRGILLDQQQQMSASVFKNVVALGLALQKLEWVERFIADYTLSLPAAERTDSINYNIAKLEFARGSYRKVVRLLRDTDFTSVFVRIDARTLLMKTWFEMGETDALDSLLDSFDSMIRRQRNLGYHPQNYLNMIRLTKQLVRLNRSDRPAAKALRQAIENETVLTEKAWLLSKLEA